MSPDPSSTCLEGSSPFARVSAEAATHLTKLRPRKPTGATQSSFGAFAPRTTSRTDGWWGHGRFGHHHDIGDCLKRSNVNLGDQECPSNSWVLLVPQLVALAYLPQTGHLVRAKCTAGVSLWAYLVWSLSAVLLLIYAISTRDAVFIALQGYQLLAATSIYVLSRRQDRRLCDVHCGTEVSLKVSSD